jgi:hypothetical protein
LFEATEPYLTLLSLPMRSAGGHGARRRRPRPRPRRRQVLPGSDFCL